LFEEPNNQDTMANAFYYLGIPLPVYILLIVTSIAAIGGLFWFVWRNAPPEAVGAPRRRRNEEVEEEVPRNAGRRRQQHVDSDEDSEEDEPQPGARRVSFAFSVF
jgi:hypothetical protein